MLMHDGEKASDLLRLLDHLYSVSDRIVLVWTSEGDIPDDIKTISDAYGVEWVHHLFDGSGSLADCRNIALDHLQDTGENDNIHWVLTNSPSPIRIRVGPGKLADRIS